MTANRLRVESHDNIVSNAKIVYVADDGTETDISRCITSVDVHLEVGEVSRATLHAILVDAQVSTAEAAIVKQLRVRRGWRWRRRAQSRLKHWLARSLSHEIRRELAREAHRTGR